MKDTIITARRKKIEIFTWLVCFVISFLLNWYAIAEFGASYTELYTSIFYVLLFACVLYGVWTLIRLLVFGLLKLFGAKKR